MQCPIDGSQLVMTERSGVEIDYCPQCRGVWLDRGELDKIIERSGALVATQPAVQPAPQPSKSYDAGGFYEGGRQKPKSKKRKSFLGEIFDFD